MPDQCRRASKAEPPLLAVDGIVDAVVVERIARDGSSRLVAYVVPAGAFTPDQWREALRAAAGSADVPADFVGISAVPLTVEGDPDLTALAAIPILDTSLVAAQARTLAAIPGVARSTVRIEPREPESTRSHLSDLVPASRPVATDRPSAPGGAVSTQSNSSRSQAAGLAPSVAHGPALTDPVPRNLATALRLAAATQPAHGVSCVDGGGRESRRAYPELLDQAERVLGGLRAQGLEPGDAVLLQLDHDRDIITMFWACALGGFVPVPVGVPQGYAEHHAGVSKLWNAWELLGRPVVAATRALQGDLVRVWAQSARGAVRTLAIEDLGEHRPDPAWHDGGPEEAALILLTSGSTGLPKGVTLTHRNLLARSAGTAQANDFTSTDRLLNWFPLDHVGGLVMSTVLGVYLGADQLQVATAFVLDDPVRWLDLLERHRSTMTWAPNFAFGLVGRETAALEVRRRDLSSVRFILNGGEAVVAATARRFLAVLAPHGLPATAMHPAWGMSETSSGVTFSHHFAADGIDDDGGFVEVGAPFLGVSIRIVDSQDQPLEEGTIGRLQVTGAPVTSGYFENPELNAEAFSADGWFNTGDLGVLCNGRLTIAGRSKDVIIVNGANLHSHEIEAVVEDVRGVERSFTAACAVRPVGSDTDRACVFFCASGGTSAETAVSQAIRDALVERMGLQPDYVVPVTTADIPKTSIGKIQRAQLKARFEAGEFADAAKKADLAAGNARTLPDWFFERVWTPRRARVGGRAAGRYLVFTDALGLADAVRDALGDEARTWITVEPSTTFARIDARRFGIDPARREDYQRLFACLSEEHLDIDHVLHLWTYTSLPDRPLDVSRLSRAQSDGTFSLLFLAQARHELWPETAARLVYVSTCAQTTPGQSRFAPEKGTAIGLLKTLALEMPALSCAHVDFELPSVIADAGHLVSELRAAVPVPEVAYRNGGRLEGWLAPVDLAHDPAQDLPIDDGGLYLISGGLGGLGTELARYLLQVHRAKVLLIGRTPLGEPPDGRTMDAGDVARWRRYRLLCGVQHQDDVMYRGLDVSDAGALSAAIAAAETRWARPLSGVFHLAGVSSLERHGAVADQHWSWLESTATFDWMFGSKVRGTQALFDVLANRPEVLFAAFSSVNGVFGGTTYSAYSAANSGLDALCAARRASTHPRTYGFNWTMWDGAGMSDALPAYVRDGSRDLGYRILSVAQGLQSMLAALHRRPRQLVVGLDATNRHVRRHLRAGCRPLQQLTAYYSSADAVPSRLVRTWATELTDWFGTACEPELVAVTAEGWTADGPPAEAVRGSVRSAASSLAPRSAVEARIAGIWREVLSIPTVGVRDRFFDLGGDSLLAMRLVNRLREAFGVELSPRALFESPTIEALAATLPESVPSAPPPAGGAAADAQVAALTDDEVDAMLRRLSSPGVSGP